MDRRAKMNERNYKLRSSGKMSQLPSNIIGVHRASQAPATRTASTKGTPYTREQSTDSHLLGSYAPMSIQRPRDLQKEYFQHAVELANQISRRKA